MIRILLIVEGEVREKHFFDRYKVVKKMEGNLEVVPFNQNIKELFRICKSYIFDGIKPNSIIDILKDSNISKDDKELLNGNFTDVFLIFDFDIQNARQLSEVEQYIKEIRELVAFFNDSTSIGQILINYPMMDSIYHIQDDAFENYKDICIPSDIDFNKKYKKYLYNKKLTYDCSKLNKNDFDMLAAINLKKANYIVNNDYNRTDFNTYEYSLNQLSILDKQTSYINENGYIYVLNSSLFMDVDLFGRTLYFHKRGERLFNDDVLINNLKNK